MTSISSITGGMSLVNQMTDKEAAAAASKALQMRGPSLVDYLNASDSGTTDVVSFSAQAQQLLAMQQASIGGSSLAADSDGGLGAKDAAVDFIAAFFENSGIDVSKMSAEAKSFLSGLNKVIDDMGAVTQDSAFDTMTKGYVRGQRESFSLQGEGQRLSLTVQYSDGKPTGLTVTTLSGRGSTSAAITLGMDAEGKASTIEISRNERRYSSQGNQTSAVALDPLSLSLFA